MTQQADPSQTQSEQTNPSGAPSGVAGVKAPPSPPAATEARTTQAISSIQGQAPKQVPLFQIVPLKKTIEERFIKMLIYGKYGAGKTTLAATAGDVPKMRDILVISAEGGEMSLMNSPKLIDVEYVDVVRITAFRQLQQIKDFLTAHIIFRKEGNEEKLRTLQERVLDPNEDGRLRRFHTVIIDSLTELNEYCMQDLLGLHQGFSFAGELPAPEFKEYKQNHAKMQLLVRMFRDLDMNVIMTAAASYEQDELKAYHFTPSMTGQLSNKIQGFFDIVGFLQTGSATEDKNAPRRLYIQPVGGRFDAKSRIAKCRKAYFDDPTMLEIMKQVGLSS